MPEIPIDYDSVRFVKGIARLNQTDGSQDFEGFAITFRNSTTLQNYTYAVISDPRTGNKTQMFRLVDGAELSEELDSEQIVELGDTIDRKAMSRVGPTALSGSTEIPLALKESLQAILPVEGEHVGGLGCTVPEADLKVDYTHQRPVPNVVRQLGVVSMLRDFNIDVYRGDDRQRVARMGGNTDLVFEPPLPLPPEALPEVVGTGDQLRVAIDARIARDSGDDSRAFPEFEEKLYRMLVDRIANRPRGITTLGYFLEVQMLLNDCRAGINTYTEVPMPNDLTGKDEAVYAVFEEISSTGLAQEAFGDEFAQELRALMAKHKDS